VGLVLYNGEHAGEILEHQLWLSSFVFQFPCFLLLTSTYLIETGLANLRNNGAKQPGTQENDPDPEQPFDIPFSPALLLEGYHKYNKRSSGTRQAMKRMLVLSGYGKRSAEARQYGLVGYLPRDHLLED
jgi:hypothetical protein